MSPNRVRRGESGQACFIAPDRHVGGHMTRHMSASRPSVYDPGKDGAKPFIDGDRCPAVPQVIDVAQGDARWYLLPLGEERLPLAPFFRRE